MDGDGKIGEGSDLVGTNTAGALADDEDEAEEESKGEPASTDEDALDAEVAELEAELAAMVASGELDVETAKLAATAPSPTPSKDVTYELEDGKKVEVTLPAKYKVVAKAVAGIPLREEAAMDSEKLSKGPKQNDVITITDIVVLEEDKKVRGKVEGRGWLTIKDSVVELYTGSVLDPPKPSAPKPKKKPAFGDLGEYRCAVAAAVATCSGCGGHGTA